MVTAGLTCGPDHPTEDPHNQRKSHRVGGRDPKGFTGGRERGDDAENTPGSECPAPPTTSAERGLDSWPTFEREQRASIAPSSHRYAPMPDGARHAPLPPARPGGAACPASPGRRRVESKRRG